MRYRCRKLTLRNKKKSRKKFRNIYRISFQKYLENFSKKKQTILSELLWVFMNILISLPEIKKLKITFIKKKKKKKNVWNKTCSDNDRQLLSRWKCFRELRVIFIHLSIVLLLICSSVFSIKRKVFDREQVFCFETIAWIDWKRNVPYWQ